MVRSNGRRALGALVAITTVVATSLVLAAAPAGAAVTTTLTNGAAISVPEQGRANPYPSTITASGLGSSITDLTVRMNISHACSKDLDILLVAPDGTKTTLMSDVGETGIPVPNPFSCNELRKTVIVSDTGVAMGTSVPSGNPITIKPSDQDGFGHQGDSWPGVGDELPANNLATFDGRNPNGQWRLYVVDDSSNDSGAINGWSITITVANGPPTAINQSIDVYKGQGRAVALAGTDPDGDVLTCQPTTGVTAKGTVSGSGCNVAYTAGVRTQGGDSFGFRVRDSVGQQSGQGTVSVSIVNRNPAAASPTLTVPAGSTVAVQLGGTDPDPGEALALTCAPGLGDTPSGKGRVSGSGCNVTYRANAGASGTDTFGFSVADGFGGLANGTVTVEIGPATLPGCSPGDSQVQRYVCRVYLDMLGRTAEPGGKAYWVDRITSGQPRYEILSSFSKTEEYRVRAVRRMYTALLGRDATTSERTAGAELLRTQNPDAVRARIVGSDEYLGRAGGLEGWAPAMYQQLLRRPATPIEAAQAESAVIGGASRASVALQLLGTPEADTVTVQSVYEAYLRRTPPSSETGFWVGRLQGGVFETRMIVEIVAAPEYFAKA